MALISFRSRLLTAALGATLILGGAACGNGDLSEEEQLLGEGAAALTSSEDDGDLGAGDAAADASDEDLAAQAGEEADASQPPPEAAGDVCDFSGARQRVLREYDANGNGKLDRDEMVALKEDLGISGLRPRLARLGWRFRVAAFRSIRWAFDENGDHQLSADERTAMIDALEARCERRRQMVLDRFDANDDGTLDDSERRAARAAFRARLQARYDRILAQYDVNSNGVLDDAERMQLKADLIARARALRQELMRQYDTDHDGQLSDEEKLALRRAIQARIANGPTEDETVSP